MSICKMTTRPIRQNEINLIWHLLQLTKEEIGFDDIPTLVADLDDGGMGSIRFVNNDLRIFGRELIMVEYIDQDNIDVLISIYLDDQDDLFELDIWKVDFNKLIRYPKPEELKTD